MLPSEVSTFEGKKSNVGANVGAPNAHPSCIFFVCKMSGTTNMQENGSNKCDLLCENMSQTTASCTNGQYYLNFL